MIYATTKRDKIRSAPDAYHRQYEKNYGQAFLAGGRDPYETTLALRKLNLETATEADIAAAIGNPSWTELKCHHCETDQQRIVTIEGPYESMSLCAECLASAMSAFGQDAEERLEAKPASAVGEAETPSLSSSRPTNGENSGTD